MRYLLALIMLLAASVADAATLYVNNSGSPSCSDATAKASNNAASPWCTIGRAAWGNAARSSPSSAEAADAGDTVLIAPGTYTTAGQGTVGCTSACARNVVAYNSYNSGSSGNPITYRCTADLGCVLTYSSGAGPVIGACGSCGWGATDYIYWEGFDLSEVTAPSVPDTGLVVFNTVTGGGLRRSRLDGNGGSLNDNHTGVRIENSSLVEVSNTEIHNLTNGPSNSDANATGIEVYNGDGLTIEHNLIYDAGSCIFFKAIGFNGNVVDHSKDADQQDVVRYNVCHDATYAFIDHRHFHTSSTVYTLWYQNIAYSGVGTGNSGITLWAFPLQTTPTVETHDGPSNARFVNNTIDGFRYGVQVQGGPVLADVSNNIVKNNLITNSVYAIYTESSGGGTNWETDRVEFDRNWYWTFTSGFMRDTSTKNFATWQSTYTGQDVNSTAGTDPEYTNAATHDYHIANASALTAGRVVHSIGGSDGDTIPVGAYITGSETIGVETGASSPTIFNPTINLRRTEIDMLRDDLTAFQTEQAARWTRVCAVLGRTRTTWAANMRREIPC